MQLTISEDVTAAPLGFTATQLDAAPANYWVRPPQSFSVGGVPVNIPETLVRLPNATPEIVAQQVAVPIDGLQSQLQITYDETQTGGDIIVDSQLAVPSQARHDTANDRTVTASITQGSDVQTAVDAINVQLGQSVNRIKQSFFDLSEDQLGSLTTSIFNDDKVFQYNFEVSGNVGGVIGGSVTTYGFFEKCEAFLFSECGGGTHQYGIILQAPSGEVVVNHRDFSLSKDVFSLSRNFPNVVAEPNGLWTLFMVIEDNGLFGDNDTYMDHAVLQLKSKSAQATNVGGTIAIEAINSPEYHNGVQLTVAQEDVTTRPLLNASGSLSDSGSSIAVSSRGNGTPVLSAPQSLANLQVTVGATNTAAAKAFELGDLNRDGFDDLALADADSLDIYFGGSDTSAIMTTADITIAGAGLSATAGDWNTDGATDLAVSDNAIGSTYVFWSVVGKLSPLTLADADVEITAAQSASFAQQPAIDGSGDGLDDLVFSTAAGLHVGSRQLPAGRPAHRFRILGKRLGPRQRFLYREPRHREARDLPKLARRMVAVRDTRGRQRRRHNPAQFGTTRSRQ